MKFGAYTEYDSRRVALAESALMTVWPNLEPWYDEIVLVGGLVPRYICGDLSASRSLPRPVTLDADIGIALGASAGEMASMQFALQEKGFRKIVTEDRLVRYVKTAADYSIPLDFLTESPPHTHGSAHVDDIVANVMPGVNRALQTARAVRVTGNDLSGNPQTLCLRVCDVGPFLAMKLRAFAARQEAKDAFDILYTLRYYDQGTAAAVVAFAQEVRLKNPACPDALRCLERDFSSESSSAPIKAAHFLLGRATPGEGADLRTHRLQIQQDMVDAGSMLKTALSGIGRI